MLRVTSSTLQHGAELLRVLGRDNTNLALGLGSEQREQRASRRLRCQDAATGRILSRQLWCCRCCTPRKTFTARTAARPTVSNKHAVAGYSHSGRAAARHVHPHITTEVHIKQSPEVAAAVPPVSGPADALSAAQPAPLASRSCCNCDGKPPVDGVRLAACPDLDLLADDLPACTGATRPDP